MKKYFILSVVYIFTTMVYSQNHLASFYNSYSQVYGGMEDGGINRTESYYFKVANTIQIKDVMENGKLLQLKKGDTLIVNIHSYIPYNNHVQLLDSTKSSESNQEIFIDDQKKFSVYRQGHKIYLNAGSNINWDKTIHYIYKSKMYTSKAKDGFDSGNTGYAP